MTDHAELDDVLREQLVYYEERAGEYDRWFRREGRYDRGAQATAAWSVELAEVRAALAEVPLDGAEVLELAGGTGIWTELIAPRAGHLTVVDGSRAMVAENRKRLGPAANEVSYVLADLFEWAPERTFDAVVFCFWISHVPDERLDRFLAGVAAMVRPGGAVFFLDGRPEPTSTAADHLLPAAGDETMLRRLDDGREFRIIKRFRSGDALEARCRRAGLDVRVEETAHYFQYASGTRR